MTTRKRTISLNTHNLPLSPSLSRSAIVRQSFPARMSTSHHPNDDVSLTEIKQGIWSLLKINEPWILKAYIPLIVKSFYYQYHCYHPIPFIYLVVATLSLSPSHTHIPSPTWTFLYRKRSTMIAVYDILDFLSHPLIAVSLTLPVSPACTPCASNKFLHFCTFQGIFGVLIFKFSTSRSVLVSHRAFQLAGVPTLYLDSNARLKHQEYTYPLSKSVHPDIWYNFFHLQCKE